MNQLKLKIPGKLTTPSAATSAPRPPAQKDFAETIGNATAPGERNPTLPEGEYKLQIIMTEMRMRSMCFRAELYVLASSNESRIPGMVVTYLRGTKDDGAAGDIQRFLFSALGFASLDALREGGIDIVELARAAQDAAQNPLAGFFIGCRVRPHVTQKGINITKEYFYALTEAEQAELRAAVAG